MYRRAVRCATRKSRSERGAERSNHWAAVDEDRHFAYTVHYVFCLFPIGVTCVPIKALKGCNYAGCPNLTDQGMYCPQHRPKPIEDDRRDSAARRGYDARWRKLREMFLRRHPTCADPFGVHQHAGVVVVATDVDHILPKRAGGADSYDNLQSLCHACHSRKTATQSSGWGGRLKSLAG